MLVEQVFSTYLWLIMKLNTFSSFQHISIGIMQLTTPEIQGGKCWNVAKKLFLEVKLLMLAREYKENTKKK